MNRKYAGFTLIETLLAIFITAILITILSVVFNTGLRSYRQGRDLLEITRKAQLVFGQMTTEIAGAMVQADYIPFKGTGSSVFFMAPLKSNGLDLCEAGYFSDRDILRRHEVAEGGSGFEYPEKVDYGALNRQPFCEGIKEFKLRYYDGSGWKGTWDSFTNLPEMVEVKVAIQGEYPKDNPQSKKFTIWIYLPNSTNNP